VVAVAAGASLSVALKSDGTVWSWGRNDMGQLGDGTTTTRLAPVQVSGLSGVSRIAAGTIHGLALKSDGTVWAWGYNAYGQLGDGTTTDRSVPVQASGLSGAVVSLAAGSEHSVALKSDGSVWAWGVNSNGQIGDGTSTTRSAPIRVSGLTNITSIAAGVENNLAIDRNGTIWAWGHNWFGQIGDGNTMIVSVPTETIGLGVPDLAILMTLAGNAAVGSPLAYTITVTNAGGEPTTGTITVTDSLPHGLVYLSGVGAGWSCAMASQTVTCTNPGPLSAGGTSTITLNVYVGPGAYPGVTNTARVTNASDPNESNNLTGDPVAVTQRTGTGVADVKAGSDFTLKLDADGTVWAWGENSSGQLGDGQCCAD